MRSIDSILVAVQALPPFPEVARKALTILSDPDYAVSEVVRVVGYDQSITAEILRLANSPYFGLSRRVGSVRQAVSLLGKRSLSDLIIASSTLRYFKAECPGYRLKGRELWRHSVACALMAQILERRLGMKLGQDAFTVGLLHDIGKLVLSFFVQEQMDRILSFVEDGYSFLEAERAVLGLDHAEVGAQITEQWNFPKSITRSIQYHHRPQDVDEGDHLTCVIYLANIVCLLMGEGGTGIDGLNYRGYAEIMSRFRLRPRDLDSSFLLLDEEIQKSEELLKTG